MRGSIICLFIIFIVCNASKSFAQKSHEVDTTISPLKIFHSQLDITGDASLFTSLRPLITALPGDLYLKNLGFFCSKELQLDKVTKVPVRFRLGSVVYTDKMESKNTFNPRQR